MSGGCTECGGYTSGDQCSFECTRHARGWGLLELHRTESGWRHYLCDEPVRCGTGLLLQQAPVIEPIEGDYMPSERRLYERDRELAAKLRAERAKSPLLVRYESPLAVSTREPPALLYVDIGGHSAIITGESWMKLRWPMKARP